MKKQLKQFGVGTMLMLSLCGARLAMAQAGERGGNGGDAVVCRDAAGKIISAELLDYYEGRTRADIQVADNSKYSLIEHTDLLFQKLKQMDPFFERAKPEAMMLAKAIDNYLKEGESRQGEVLFTSDILADINDSDHLSFPRGCKVEQLAIRIIEKNYENDPNYLIQEEILRHLPLKDLKGLVIHEVIYKTFLDKDKTTKNSKTTRKLNQFISSLSLKELNLDNYIPAVKEVFNLNSIWTKEEKDLYSRIVTFNKTNTPEKGRGKSSWCNGGTGNPARFMFDKKGKYLPEETTLYGSVEISNVFVTGTYGCVDYGEIELMDQKESFHFGEKIVEKAVFKKGQRAVTSRVEIRDVTPYYFNEVLRIGKKGAFFSVVIKIETSSDAEEKFEKSFNPDGAYSIEITDVKFIKL